jgi:hypothetical protein
MTTKRKPVSSLRVTTPERHDVTTPEAPAKAERGSATNPRLSLRFASRADWMAAHEFALQRGKSLNELFLEGFADLQQRAGLKPIKTKP